jgi:tetratricopeptide (TPR) repeat protein
MSGVFISYRRADSGGWAGRLFDHLSMRFGKDLVFQDFDDIKPGTDFVTVIRTAIAACEVCLVVIGPQWLQDAQGRRRLDNPDDVLRMEIVEALEHDRTVIPVLVGGARMPSSENLPDAMARLSRIHAVDLSDSRWNYDVEHLINRLRELIAPTREQLSLSQAQQELYHMQQRYFELPPHRAADALELAQQALDRLDQVLPLYPQDPYLQLIRGFFHKNKAMALRDLKRAHEFEQALDQAERIFRTIGQERPDEAAAWNGLGSVESLRGNLEQALRYIDRALEIDPDYEAALADREEVLRHLKGNK